MLDFLLLKKMLQEQMLIEQIFEDPIQLEEPSLAEMFFKQMVQCLEKTGGQAKSWVVSRA
jgi:hypothetical protein